MHVYAYNIMEKSNHLVFAIDFGKANLGRVLESSIGFSKALKRSHYSLKKRFTFMILMKERETREGEKILVFFLIVLSLRRVFWYFEDVMILTNLWILMGQLSYIGRKFLQNQFVEFSKNRKSRVLFGWDSNYLNAHC